MLPMEQRCVLCNWDTTASGMVQGEPVILCGDCVDRNAVRVFCYRCKVRMSLTLAEARALFQDKSGTKTVIGRNGIVVFFPDGCPTCAPDGQRVEPRFFGLELQWLH